MKWLIASDIHGSSMWCGKLIEAFEKEKADRLILLGDLLYHGPRNPLPDEHDTMKTAGMLNQYKDSITAVRGNCDAEIDQMVLEFPMMADYAVMEQKGHLIFITHGHLYNKDAMPPIHKGDVLLHGHTHVTVCEPVGDCFYLNPGSVSMPKDGTDHGYMTLEDGVFVWKTFAGGEFKRWSVSDR